MKKKEPAPIITGKPQFVTDGDGGNARTWQFDVPLTEEDSTMGWEVHHRLKLYGVSSIMFKFAHLTSPILPQYEAIDGLKSARRACAEAYRNAGWTVVRGVWRRL